MRLCHSVTMLHYFCFSSWQISITATTGSYQWNIGCIWTFKKTTVQTIALFFSWPPCTTFNLFFFLVSGSVTVCLLSSSQFSDCFTGMAQGLDTLPKQAWAKLSPFIHNNTNQARAVVASEVNVVNRFPQCATVTFCSWHTMATQIREARGDCWLSSVINVAHLLKRLRLFQ